MSIQGKHAIITGLSKGIGLALSQALLEKGVKVTGWGLHAPKETHADLQFISCDVSKPEQVDAAWKTTIEIRPHVDFLINNAGFGYFSPIESFSIEQWNRMLDVNLTGTFLVCRKVAGQMKAQKSGHILNISSIAGKTGSPQGEGYNASKFGVAGFSDSLFQELRPYGIKVTTVFPGSVQTAFFDSVEGIVAHSNMLQANDLAQTLVHIMDSPPNYLIREIEIRPLHSKPPNL